jgi:predicted nucleic acid-binding Zn ribbon protein
VSKRKRRKSSGQPESIDDILRTVFVDKKFGASARVAELWGQWRKMVGDDVAEHCYPEKIAGEKLYIKVDNPVWCQQLDFLKEELKEKINHSNPARPIKKLVIRQA